MNLDYVAGFLDGEGCIQMAKSTKNPYVDISQANKEVLDKICELVGQGGVYKIKKYKDSNKQMFHWVVTGLSAIEFIETIVDRLVVKKPEAELLIKSKHLFQRHKKKLSQETLEGREELRLQLQALKKQ